MTPQTQTEQRRGRPWAFVRAWRRRAGLAEAPAAARPSVAPDVGRRGQDGRVVLASCRSSWQAPLTREAAASLEAEVYPFDESAELERITRDLATRDKCAVLAIVDLSHRGPAALSSLNELLPGVPVLAIGDRNDLDERLSAAAVGAAAFLASPLSIREIVRVGRRLLQQGPLVSVRRTGIPVPQHLIFESKP